MDKVTPDPRLSIEAFFLFLSAMMFCSLLAFLFLNFHSGCKEEHASNHLIVPNEETPQYEVNSRWIYDHKGQFYLLMLIQAYVCFLSNGAFPSIQTYSCLPYGNTVYHLSVTLHAMANPVMAFFAFFKPCTKDRSIAMITLVGSIFAAFLMATALTSPDMLWGQDVGGALTVI